MADITLASSTYQTGTNDTASTLVNNVTATDAQQYNGAASAIIGIETILGTGTDLKGSTADLVARLAVEHNADGTQKTVTVAKGGTGATSLTDGAVLVGNGTSAVTALALPSTGKVLAHSGTAGADPEWISGLVMHGPSSCGTGSTRSHEGTVTVNADGNYSGIHFYTDFTLNSGKTMTVQAGKRRLIIIATGTITINGTINASGAGGVPGATDSRHGTDQPGGGGAGDSISTAGQAGGDVLVHGVVLQAGGAAGNYGSGVTGTQVTASDLGGILASPLLAMGGAAGGASAAAVSGGAGGGSIVLIAPTVVLAATATLNTSGSNGTSNAGGSSAGGGAGNVYIIARSYTDNGATFTQTGGTGGAYGGPAVSGGNGAAGIKQILIYA